MSERLNAHLLAAHDAGDGATLVGLYTQAAETAANDRVAAFFLTQAYVFALETGHPAGATLRQRLVALGCETPL